MSASLQKNMSSIAMELKTSLGEDHLRKVLGRLLVKYKVKLENFSLHMLIINLSNRINNMSNLKKPKIPIWITKICISNTINKSLKQQLKWWIRALAFNNSNNFQWIYLQAHYWVLQLDLMMVSEVCNYEWFNNRKWSICKRFYSLKKCWDHNKSTSNLINSMCKINFSKCFSNNNSNSRIHS